MAQQGIPARFRRTAAENLRERERTGAKAIERLQRCSPLRLEVGSGGLRSIETKSRQPIAYASNLALHRMSGRSS